MGFFEFRIRLVEIALKFVPLSDFSPVNAYMMIFLKDDLTLVVIDLLCLGGVEV